MGTELEIKLKDRAKAMRLKRHLEKTHPSLRGRVMVEGMCPKPMKNNFKFNPMTQAKRVTKLLK